MRKKKRAFTLLEIMIVIFLITLITGAVGYNMKGSLDKGRSFRTELAKEQLHDLLLICVEEGADGDAVAKDPADFLKRHNLAKNCDKIVQDGWGVEFSIRYDRSKNDFKIGSAAHDQYKKKNNPEASFSEEE